MTESLERAYVLHLRRYTDSRVIVDFFTQNHGVVRAVARQPGKRDRAKFEPFQSLLIRCVGTSELKSLRECERVDEKARILLGPQLFCGMYINELLQRLIHVDEPFLDLFKFYEATIYALENSLSKSEIEVVLRRMEFFLLEQLGFAVDLRYCGDSGEEVAPDRWYFYEHGHGLREYVGKDDLQRKSLCVPGIYIHALAQQVFDDETVLRAAKRITRQALGPLLGARPLKSRDLFR